MKEQRNKTGSITKSMVPLSGLGVKREKRREVENAAESTIYSYQNHSIFVRSITDMVVQIASTTHDPEFVVSRLVLVTSFRP